MKILLCGGGTGGHIVPILAIAHELKKENPSAHIIYVGEHGSKFSHLTENLTSVDEVKTIYAGKIRRYHNEPWLRRLTDLKTIYFNIRDIFRLMIGFVQSVIYLRKTKPEIIFLKGGFVGLPIGLAASLMGRPFVTHDSDSLPGLSNRLVSKWAVYNATGMPKELYSYPSFKTEFVGIPVASEYVHVTTTLMKTYRKEIEIPEKAKLILVTGGSLGAVKINKAVASVAEQLFSQNKDLYIVHQVGKGNMSTYGSYTNPNLKVEEFMSGLYRYSGAANIVITRSGATTIAELETQGKPSIVIPNPDLTGGHQTKNGQLLEEKNAAVVISEPELDQDPSILADKINMILNNPSRAKELSDNIHKLSVPNSANKIAMLLLSLVKTKQKK